PHILSISVSPCLLYLAILSLFFFNDTPTTEIYTLSLHDALPIWIPINNPGTILFCLSTASLKGSVTFLKLTINPIFTLRMLLNRSEEHTSELQSRENLVCRLLLEKKKK